MTTKANLVESTETGELQVVEDLAGYPEPAWQVVKLDCGWPKENEIWDRAKNKWEKDDAEAARKLKKSKARDPDHLLDRIEALEEELVRLGALLSAGGKVK